MTLRRPLLAFAALCAILAFIPFASCEDASGAVETAPDGTVYTYETFGSGYPGYRAEIASIDTGAEGLYVSSVLEGYPVEVLRDRASAGQSIRYAVVPATVKTLGDGVFDGCASLEAVYFLGDRPSMSDGSLPDGISVLRMPGASGWDGASEIETLTIRSPDGSTVVYAVIEGTAMAVSGTPSSDGSLTIASRAGGYEVASIGPSAFSGTHGVWRSDIRHVTVEDGVEVVRERAFYYNGGIETADLPDSVTALMDEAFRAAGSLREADIPDAVSYIGFECFRDCSSIPSIDVPDSVTFLGEGAFYICSAAATASIGAGVEEIPARAFAYCPSLESADIRGAVRSFGHQAFYLCSSLGSVNIPDSTVSLGYDCFRECSSLGSVRLGPSLETIGAECFRECKALEKAEIPASVHTVGKRAFAYCSSLEDAYFLGERPVSETGDPIRISSVFLNDETRIHCTEDHAGSWKDVEGIVIEAPADPSVDDPSSEDGSTLMAVAVAAIVLAGLVVSVVVLRRRPR